MRIYQWLHAARVALPYYSRAIDALTPVEYAPPNGPIGVDDRWRIYATDESLDAFEQLGADPVMVIHHELCHLLFEHAKRREGREPRLWNIACDAAINDDLPGAELLGVVPSKLGLPDGNTPEWYYDQAPEEPEDSEEHTGSSADGVRRPWESETAASVEREEQPDILDAVANDVHDHAKRSPPGTIPAGMVMWAEARLAAKVTLPSWSAAVRRAARVAGQKLVPDYSYARLSRRQDPGERVLLAAMSNTRTLRCATVLDTSGSAGGIGDQYAAVIKEILGTHAEHWVIDCDAAAAPPRRLNSWKDIRHSKGGGGTDMRIGLEAARAMRPKPDFVLVVTDGETPWPTVPAGALAIICDGKTITTRAV